MSPLLNGSEHTLPAFLLVMLFVLLAFLGYMFRQVLLWEQQWLQARPFWLCRLDHLARNMRARRRQTEALRAAFEASPLAVSPIKLWKWTASLLKAFKLPGPLRLLSLLR